MMVQEQTISPSGTEKFEVADKASETFVLGTSEVTKFLLIGAEKKVHAEASGVLIATTFSLGFEQQQVTNKILL